MLSCIIILIFTSRRLLQTVNDDSILCTFQQQQKAESDEVESLKGWKVLIWMHINAQFFPRAVLSESKSECTIEV